MSEKQVGASTQTLAGSPARGTRVGTRRPASSGSVVGIMGDREPEPRAPLS